MLTRHPAGGGRDRVKNAGRQGGHPLKGHPCQITRSALIKGGRSEPVALASCFYLMSPAVKTARPRTLAQLTAHPWVESVSDERGMGAGIWVYLRPGFVTHDSCHTIHETTVKECCRAFRFVSHDPEDYLLKDQAAPVPPAAPAFSVADSFANASARINAEGEAATARIFDRLGKIRTGLIALAETDAAMIAADTARPVLPGEVTPPPALNAHLPRSGACPYKG
jgi:hypothetical protein